MDGGLFNFEKSIKRLSVIYNRIHRIVDDYIPKQRQNSKTKKEFLAF